MPLLVQLLPRHQVGMREVPVSPLLVVATLQALRAGARVLPCKLLSAATAILKKLTQGKIGSAAFLDLPARFAFASAGG